jgi:hypothetical protein
MLLTLTVAAVHDDLAVVVDRGRVIQREAGAGGIRVLRVYTVPPPSIISVLPLPHAIVLADVIETEPSPDSISITSAARASARCWITLTLTGVIPRV